MPSSSPNPKVDWYFAKESQWQAEFKKLREIALSTGLTEELKWGHPCYTLDGANVVLMHGFKDYCALLFHKGALLNDEHGVLIQQTKNVQSARQMRFTSVAEITKLTRVIKNYIKQAAAIEEAGLKVELKTTAEYEMPAELTARLKADPKLKKAFEKLTPGRQRGYMYYIGSAKRSETREARIDKHVDRILAGQGIDD